LHARVYRVDKQFRLLLQIDWASGIRGLASIAWAVLGTKTGKRPNDAAAKLQNFRKLRRVMPCRRMTS
jgi:hypothetical protein